MPGYYIILTINFCHQLLLAIGVILLFLSGHILHAQKITDKLELDPGYYHIYPFNENQFIVVSEKESVTNTYTLSLYNSSLDLIRKAKITGPSVYFQELHFGSGNHIYARVTNYRKGGTQFYKYDHHLNLVSVTNSKIGTCLSLSFFKEISDSVIVVSGLLCKSSNHFTVKINLLTGEEENMHPMGFAEGKWYPYHDRLMDLEITEDETMVAVYNDYKTENDTTYINFRNNKKSSYDREQLYLGPGKRINHAQIKVNNDKILFYGSYRDDSVKLVNKSGIFIYEYENGRLESKIIFPLSEMDLSGALKYENAGTSEFMGIHKKNIDSIRKEWKSNHDPAKYYLSGMRLYEDNNGYHITGDLGYDCTDGFLVLKLDSKFELKEQTVFPILIGNDNNNYYYNDGSFGKHKDHFYYGYIYNGFAIGLSVDDQLNQHPFAIDPEKERSMENSIVQNAHMQYWYDSFFLLIYKSYLHNSQNVNLEDPKFIISKIKID